MILNIVCFLAGGAVVGVAVLAYVHKHSAAAITSAANAAAAAVQAVKKDV